MPQNTITIEALIHAPVHKVWNAYNTPKDIMVWNSASDDWHTPKAENDVRPGGKFTYRMESRDGSQGFDFSGTFDEVVKDEFLAYTISDGRTVEVSFEKSGKNTQVTVTFETENENPVEMQRQGWQSILNAFKKYVESQ